MHYMTHIPLSTKLSIVFTLFFVSMAAIASQQTHRIIEKQAADFVRDSLLNSPGEDTQIEVRSIDPRIQVPVCPQGFQFESPNFDPRLSNVSVKISCPDKQWFLFTHVQVQNMKQVVVTSETLSPGAMINSGNIQLADIEQSRLRGSAFYSLEDIRGARVKRRVRPGTVLTESMLCFVCKGDRVTISAVTGSLSIQVYGVAEEDGTLGETIQVRNISSDKMVLATVAGTDEVTIKI
uniref:flagellar basal body P-ring formation chaperone FlgA n=1 Tax=Ningiella ruwaisensis TaxID=2364274 RepID=UPI00109FC134|nr:flagellar basal body P-ring formation chaperone FlgA [Ningiella ruwaisensis]